MERDGPGMCPCAVRLALRFSQKHVATVLEGGIGVDLVLLLQRRRE